MGTCTTPAHHIASTPHLHPWVAVIWYSYHLVAITPHLHGRADMGPTGGQGGGFWRDGVADRRGGSLPNFEKKTVKVGPSPKKCKLAHKSCPTRIGAGVTHGRLRLRQVSQGLWVRVADCELWGGGIPPPHKALSASLRAPPSPVPLARLFNTAQRRVYITSI